MKNLRKDELESFERNNVKGKRKHACFQQESSIKHVVSIGIKI